MFRESALEWATRATEYQPERATWWARLALTQLLFDQRDGALISANRALQLQPNEPQAWLVLRQIAIDSGDDEEVVRARERVCALVPPQC